MSYRIHVICTALMIAFACLAGPRAIARAAERGPVAAVPQRATATTLTVQVIAQPDAGGQRTPLVARLLTAGGGPVPNATITFFVDGQRDGEARTDAGGNAHWRLRTNLAVGRHSITGVFEGTARLLPTRGSVTLTRAATRLDVRPAPELSQGGERVPITVHLSDASGAAVPQAPVDILIDGARDGQVVTDDLGNAVWRTRRDLPAGSYAVGAVFDGLPYAAASQATTQLVIEATRLDLTTATATPVRVGQPFTVTARLTGAADEPITNGRAVLLINGARSYEVRTDAAGAASWPVRGLATTGAYTLAVRFDGMPGFVAAQTSTQLQVEPAVVAIQTVPAVAGVRFSLDGNAFVSDADGLAQVEVGKIGTYRLKMLPWQGDDPAVRVGFARWADNVFVPERDIAVPLRAPFQAGLEVSYQVNPDFVDESGQPIDLVRIQSAMLTGSDGQAYRFNAGQNWWLKGNQINNTETGLQARKIRYTLRNVMVDQANVVNQGQQRFYASPHEPLQIETQMYTAHFLVRDAIFGFPLGSTLHLTYPDGSIHSRELGPDADLTFAALARGTYSVKVDAQGISSPTPIAMSRDQDAYLLVVSYIDLGVGAIALAIPALGLVLLGRPQVRAVGRGMVGFAGAMVRRPTQLRAHTAAMRATLARGATANAAAQRDVALRTRRGWRRVFDPMVGYTAMLLLIGGVGLWLANSEATTLHANGGAATPTTMVTTANEAPARPVTAPLLPTPRPTVALPTPRPLDAADTTTVTFDTSFKLGQRSPQIVQLQQRLRELGYFDYPENTGYFGEITQRAVAQFQADQQLPSNGTPDRKLITRLNTCTSDCVKK